MYIHAYKLNFEYNLKKHKNYCILLDNSVYGLIQDPAPYWNEGWACKTNDIYAKYNGFQMYNSCNKKKSIYWTCRCV